MLKFSVSQRITLTFQNQNTRNNSILFLGGFCVLFFCFSMPTARSICIRIQLMALPNPHSQNTDLKTEYHCLSIKSIKELNHRGENGCPAELFQTIPCLQNVMFAVMFSLKPYLREVSSLTSWLLGSLLPCLSSLDNPIASHTILLSNNFWLTLPMSSSE